MIWNNWGLRTRKTVAKRSCLFKTSFVFLPFFFLMTSVLHTPPLLFHIIITSLFQFYSVLPTVITNLFANLVVLFPPAQWLSFQTTFLTNDTPRGLSVEIRNAGVRTAGALKLDSCTQALLWCCGHWWCGSHNQLSDIVAVTSGRLLWGVKALSCE